MGLDECFALVGQPECKKSDLEFLRALQRLEIDGQNSTRTAFRASSTGKQYFLKVEGRDVHDRGGPRM